MSGKSTDDWEDGDENNVRERWRDGRPEDYDNVDDAPDDYEEGSEGDGVDDDDNDSDTAPCPKCGAEIYDLADYCPACGEAIHAGQRRLSWRTLAIAGGLAFLLLVATYACRC